jgi:acetyl-CoA C-acetyltransferase
MDVFIYDAVRTPRGKGKSNGALFEVKPIELVNTLMTALVTRNQLDTSLVDDVILGCVTPIGEQGGNIAKAAALYAGWDYRVSGMQINRFCASGLEAINLAAMKIASGWEDMVVAGGVESMSRVPIGTDGGALLIDPKVNSKIGFVPQGISADLIATIEGYSRQMLDNYALQSQQRAAFAQQNGYFKKSIIPIYDVNGLPILEADEYLRPSTNLETLAALPSAFSQLGQLGFDAMALKKYAFLEKINHLHTAGNSSGIVDGAALLLIGNAQMGQKLDLKPRAKIKSLANSGSEPTIMLLGPAPAAFKALAKAKMKPSDIDLFEMNEAFSAPVLAFQNSLNIPDDKLNVNGGAIALGHPLGATGAILVNTVLDELERQNLGTALITLCVGGGMGVATIIERL